MWSSPRNPQRSPMPSDTLDSREVKTLESVSSSFDTYVASGGHNHRPSHVHGENVSIWQLTPLSRTATSSSLNSPVSTGYTLANT